jgi:hypothetical protein
MAEYTINRTAAAQAAALLRDLLQTEIPEGDFTEGSAISDMLIDGHAVITGYLQNQVQVIRNRQSLRTLQYLPESESVSDAADAILDNFFRTRAQGRFAKGVATLRFSQRQDVLIPRSARFFKTTSLVFYIDSNVDLFIFGTDLRPDINGNGEVVSYSTTVFMTAARVGADYNVTAGRFISFDRFNAFLSSVENLSAFSGGESVQSTADFVSRSTNAIALRALINERSNDATLLETFPDVQSTTTVGYGDPEMVRDLVKNVANSFTIHVGGHMDIFVRQPIQEITQRLSLNTLQFRNDNRNLIFRHTITTPSGSFIAAGVVAGDILRIAASTVFETAFDYVITRVDIEELEISAQVPFPIATDELTPVPGIAYSIGNNYPAFNDKVSVAVATSDATTSRQISEFNRTQLPGVPTYSIKKVELLGPTLPAAMLPYADPVSGNVIFTERKNAAITTTPPVGSPLGFYVNIKNPQESQSAYTVAMLEVGWPAVPLTNLVVDVTYETPTNFLSVHTYVASRFNRPACSSTLTRAAHPVYVYAAIPYKQRTTPVSPLSTTVPTFDSVAAEKAMQTYINDYQSTEALDVSLIATEARSVSDAVASIYTFKVTYELYLPDGRVMLYETEDKITVFPDETTSSARLVNGADFGLPTTGYAVALRTLLTNQGISDRVTRYRATDGAVVFDRRA